MLFFPHHGSPESSGSVAKKNPGRARRRTIPGLNRSTFAYRFGCASCYSTIDMASSAGALTPLHRGQVVRRPHVSSQHHLSGTRLRIRVTNGCRVHAFWKFNKKSLRTTSEDAGIYGSQGRDEYGYDDVEQYFNYMGMLATEGSYDKLKEMTDSGLHPADILLIWASKENDHPKVAELLRAGADKSVKDLNGKSLKELTTSEEVLALLDGKNL